MKTNKQILEQMISGVNDAIIETVPPAAAVVDVVKDTVDDDAIEIPAHVPTKTKGRAPEDSVAILRKQRDEARQQLAEREAAIQTADANGDIYAVVKELIKKDDVTPDDLKNYFKDYDFTVKEKEALATQLKETQDKLKDYDIRQSSDFIEQFENPYIEAQKALVAEIVPIVDGEQVTNQKAAMVIRDLIASNDINPSTVKIAIHKIRDAYEDEGVDYDMPSVQNVISGIRSVINLHKKTVDAYNNWEQTKTQKTLEKAEINQTKSEISIAKTRQERKVIAQGYIAELAKSENYDYIADMHGHENVMNTAVASHNELGAMMDDPAKAPTYNTLLDLMTKARLYDALVLERANQSTIQIAQSKKVKIENLGVKPSSSASNTPSSNKDLLRSAGVQVS